MTDQVDPRIDEPSALAFSRQDIRAGKASPVIRGLVDIIDSQKRRLDALAAADKAATITTVEELDAVPAGSVAMGWAYDGSTPYLRCLTIHGRLVWGCVGQADLFTSADLLKDGFKARIIHWGTE